MTRIGYICLDPRAWATPEAEEATIARFHGYSLIVTTAGGGGPTAAFVNRLRGETGAVVARYFDPFYLLPAVTMLFADHFVRRASNHTIADRWGDGRGLYLHTEATASILAQLCYENSVSHALTDLYLDSTEPVMPPWLVTWFGDTARPSRLLSVNGKYLTPAQLAAEFQKSSALVTPAFRAAFGPSSVIIANTGMPRRDPAIDGVCLEEWHTPGDWMSSLPPATTNPRPRFDCAIVRDDAERAQREATVLPGNVVRLYDRFTP